VGLYEPSRVRSNRRRPNLCLFQEGCCQSARARHHHFVQEDGWSWGINGVVDNESVEEKKKKNCRLQKPQVTVPTDRAVSNKKHLAKKAGWSTSKTMNSHKLRLRFDGLLQRSRVEYCNRNHHACDQNTAVSPAPAMYPRWVRWRSGWQRRGFCALVKALCTCQV